MGGSDVVEMQYHDAFSGKRSISPIPKCQCYVWSGLLTKLLKQTHTDVVILGRTLQQTVKLQNLHGKLAKPATICVF